MDSCEHQKVILIINSVFSLSFGFLTPWWYCDSYFGVVFTLVFVLISLLGSLYIRGLF
jgi:hypothetical protein